MKTKEQILADVVRFDVTKTMSRIQPMVTVAESLKAMQEYADVNRLERDQKVIETFIRKYFDDDEVLFIVNNDWDYQFKCFTESDEYKNITQ